MLYIRKNSEKRFSKVVELYDEKTDRSVRLIRFKNIKDFDKFLEDFRLMRYPGYSWRIVDKKIK